MARLRQIVFDCRHPAGLARFWSEALDEFEIRAYDDEEIERLATLGFTPETDPTVLVDGPGLELCFQLISPLHPGGKRRVHLDIESSDLNAEVQRLTNLGATIVERFDAHVWMRDPEGNDFCVSDTIHASLLEIVNAKRRLELVALLGEEGRFEFDTDESAWGGV
jgi:Glyoxalase-like domain